LVEEDELEAVRLVQGHGSKSVEAGNELWKLSALATSIPMVRQRLSQIASTSALQSLSQLEHEPDARPFLDAFAAYLEDYGWRSDLFELAEPTWAEDPTIPLCQLSAYMEMDGYDPLREQQRLGQERDEFIARTMARLEPEGRTRLQAVLEGATDLAPLQEDHNFYIDQRLAFMPRRLVLAIARRLVSAGMLDAPSDIFYLRVGEVRSALREETGDYRDIAARRREEMAGWAEESPPPTLGAPAPASDGLPTGFGGSRQLPADQPNLLHGNASSAGIARGPARVLRNLGEVDRLKPGDVMVARTTMPAWTPLFAVACAIVVETGGVLSHPAVTAREYGIPAVLGVSDATRVLRDGQLLEVDGTRGTVRVL
jgi:pyruvate,water dikinase